MRPKKKKKRQFRQAFARTLQRIAPRRSGDALFSGPLRSIAILAQEKLGDCVLLTPLVRNLRKAFPGLEIHIIAFSRASRSFFENDPDVSFVHDAKREAGRYARAVLSRQFDLLFNTKDHPSTHFLLQSVLIPARFKAGHRNGFHEGLFDHLIDSDFHTHMALKNCALLPLLGVSATEEQCRPSLPPMPVSESLGSFVHGLEKGQLIGINISAGEANREWTEGKWSELVERFPDKRFVVLSGPGEVEMKTRIEKRHRNIVASPPTKNLYEVMLIVESLRLLVTPDTSLIHIASGTGTPVVGLYREAPQDISRFGPYRIPSELVVSPTGEVAGIARETVAAAVERMLESNGRE